MTMMTVHGEPFTTATIGDYDPVSRLLADLIACRRRRHMRQQDVADTMGCSRSTVSRIERGRPEIRLSQLYAYVSAVDVRIRREISP